MKRILVLIILLFALPSFADIRINTDTGVKYINEYTIRNIQTRKNSNNYSVIIQLRNGTNHIITSHRKDIDVIYYELYQHLGDFYGWSSYAINYRMKQNDKGGIIGEEGVVQY